MARAAARTEADLEKLVGWKCLKGVGGLLAHLHEHHDCPNRKLHYDQYAALLLFYFFNATVASLRDLRRLTDFEKFRRKLGVERTSLGSLSEASQVFDGELLRGVFEELAGTAAAADAPARPAGMPGGLDLVAADSSIIEALPRMVWALWLRKEHNGVRLHLDFDILKGIPVAAEVTTGRTGEKARLRKRLEKGRLYVYDRGFADYGLFQAVLDAGLKAVVPAPFVYLLDMEVILEPAMDGRTVTVTVPRRIESSADQALIQNEIKQFYALEGRYPESLEELVEWRGEPLPQTPRGYVYSYDAATGELLVVPEG